MNTCCQGQDGNERKIAKNKMTVSWHFNMNRIHFELSAPTNGWVAIGFNAQMGITNTYLLMGNVINDRPNVEEYFTLKPGDYQSLKSLGISNEVKNIAGYENNNNTYLQFSLPIKAQSKYQRDLSTGKDYVMLIAYSQEDDFQHHSIMRTSINVKL